MWTGDFSKSGRCLSEHVNKMRAPTDIYNSNTVSLTIQPVLPTLFIIGIYALTHDIEMLGRAALTKVHTYFFPGKYEDHLGTPKYKCPTFTKYIQCFISFDICLAFKVSCLLTSTDVSCESIHWRVCKQIHICWLLWMLFFKLMCFWSQPSPWQVIEMVPSFLLDNHKWQL